MAHDSLRVAYFFAATGARMNHGEMLFLVLFSRPPRIHSGRWCGSAAGAGGTRLLFLLI